MVRIPKRVQKRYATAIKKFKRILRNAQKRDVNEADTVSIVRSMLTELFGYEEYGEITSEFAIGRTRVDLAIIIDDTVQFLIEVKAIGKTLSESHIRQAKGYGSDKGIEWVVLTNGMEWRLYRIKFGRPVSHSLVHDFDFLELKSRNQKDNEALFLLSKEGIPKHARDAFHRKAQTVNKHVIGHLITAEPVVAVIRRELKKLARNLQKNRRVVSPQVEKDEVRTILNDEVLKRDIFDGDKAKKAKTSVRRLYRKPRRAKKKSASPN